MKAYENKTKLITTLQKNIPLWNRYQLSIGLKLEFRLDLSWANLSWANLSWANLSWADLSGADLSGADLDMSCWPLSYKTLSIKKTSLKLRVQLCFHFAKLIENEENPTPEEKVIYNQIIDYANTFHLANVKKLKSLK